MTTLSRRSFLIAVGAGLAGYGALSLAKSGPESTPPHFNTSGYVVSTNVAPATTPIPYPVVSNSRGGIVTAVNGSDLTIDDLRGSQFVLRLTSATVRDEGAWTGTIPIVPGDSVIAQTHLSAGVSEADSIWTNVTKVEGEVLDVIDGPVAPFQVRMRNGRDVLDQPSQWDVGHLVQVDKRTGVVLPRAVGSGPVQREPAADQALAIAPGDHLLVIGKQMPDDMVLAVSLMSEGI